MKWRWWWLLNTIWTKDDDVDVDTDINWNDTWSKHWLKCQSWFVWSLYVLKRMSCNHNDKTVTVIGMVIKTITRHHGHIQTCCKTKINEWNRTPHMQDSITILEKQWNKQIKQNLNKIIRPSQACEPKTGFGSKVELWLKCWCLSLIAKLETRRLFKCS